MQVEAEVAIGPEFNTVTNASHADAVAPTVATLALVSNSASSQTATTPPPNPQSVVLALENNTLRSTIDMLTSQAERWRFLFSAYCHSAIV